MGALNQNRFLVGGGNGGSDRYGERVTGTQESIGTLCVSLKHPLDWKSSLFHIGLVLETRGKNNRLVVG